MNHFALGINGDKLGKANESTIWGLIGVWSSRRLGVYGLGAQNVKNHLGCAEVGV